MPDPASLTLFFVAAAALLITPGPAVLYIVARSVDRGWRAGVVSSLGISVGSLVQLLAAGSIAGRLRGNRGLVRRQRWLTGGLYILLGLAAALAGSGRDK